jgi:hypothetical protein
VDGVEGWLGVVGVCCGCVRCVCVCVCVVGVAGRESVWGVEGGEGALE